MKIMITNGGAHPADKWAEVTTDAILDLIQIDDNSTSKEAIAARAAKRDLRPILFAGFNAHHAKVQDDHRKLHAKAKASLKDMPIDVTPHMDTADDVLKILATTPFAAHFAKPEVADVVRRIVAQHTADSINIERSWHADALAQKGA